MGPQWKITHDCKLNHKNFHYLEYFWKNTFQRHSNKYFFLNFIIDNERFEHDFLEK